jgi:tetratricopeptide (TPR) repeat protein
VSAGPNGRRALEALRSRNALVLGALFAAACATAPAADVVRPVAAGLRGFLISPLVGWSEPVEEAWRVELERAYDALVAEGDLEVARTAAAALLARLGPDFDPAEVLSAQVAFAAGRAEDARPLLEPIVENHPEYVAAQLLLGRVAELGNDPWSAFEAYRAADLSAQAAERAAAVLPAALQGARSELAQALARERLDEAERWRDRMVSAAPEDPLSIDGARAVAAARGDDLGELEALRSLTAGPRPTGDRALLERRAELEMAAGEAGVAVDLYSDLNARFPGDESLKDGLTAAQFRFRLQVLPTEVSRLTTTAELTRGDFATLLYWLVPGARGGRTETANIVTDVPEEHPQRIAIVRVVNLGLMPLQDPTLRRFAPDETMLRGAALGTLLQVAAAEQTPPACLARFQGSPRPSRELVCSVAAGCGWIAEEGECLPSAPLDGPTAERLLRLALELRGQR